MPGPVITPSTPAPAPVTPPSEPVVAAPVAPEVAPPVPVSDGTTVSTNVAGSVLLPTIKYTAPRVHGEDPTDRGDKAEYLVLHTRVGQYLQGSRVTLADLGGPSAEPARLIELGAISELPKSEPTDEVPAPADPDKSSDSKPKGK